MKQDRLGKGLGKSATRMGLAMRLMNKNMPTGVNVEMTEGELKKRIRGAKGNALAELVGLLSPEMIRDVLEERDNASS